MGQVGRTCPPPPRAHIAFHNSADEVLAKSCNSSSRLVFGRDF